MKFYVVNTHQNKEALVNEDTTYSKIDHPQPLLLQLRLTVIYSEVLQN